MIWRVRGGGRWGCYRGDFSAGRCSEVAEGFRGGWVKMKVMRRHGRRCARLEGWEAKGRFSPSLALQKRSELRMRGERGVRRREKETKWGGTAAKRCATCKPLDQYATRRRRNVCCRVRTYELVAFKHDGELAFTAQSCYCEICLYTQ